MKKEVIKNKKKTARGWEWTEEERISVKPLIRKLKKDFYAVLSTVETLPNAIPEFALDAEIFGNPFLESTKEILSLDAKRKGRKWQHIPYSSVAKKLNKIYKLFDEYQNCFYLHEDFQLVQKDYLDGVYRENRKIKESEQKMVKQIISANLKYIKDLKSQKTRVHTKISPIQELLNFTSQRSFDNLPDCEIILLNSWVVLQFIDIASRQHPKIFQYVVGQIDTVRNPIDLFDSVYLLFVEQKIQSYNKWISSLPYFINWEKGAIGARDIMSGIFTSLSRTIDYRLSKELTESHSLPSMFEFSLHDRILNKSNFKNSSLEKRVNA